MSRDGKEARRAWADNAAPLVLAGIAFGGSFTHWVDLARDHGQHGVLAPAIAVCVDLGVYMATRERQRDARISRKRRGITSWPTMVLVLGICLTLAGNLASAQLDAWGIVTALVPGAMLLVAISFFERRAAEDGRRAADDELQRQAAEAAERQRQAELTAERERQEAEERAAAERQRQAGERQAQLAARRAAIVTGASAAVSPGRVPLALGAGGPAAEVAAVSATAVMRAYWDRELAAGRPVPSGADLLRAAGLSPSSSLGRQNAGKWRAELGAAADTGSQAAAAAGSAP